MRLLIPALSVSLICASCMPNQPQAKADDSATKERLNAQNERIGRMETEMHEMRLLFTSQLKRLEEIAATNSQMQAQTLATPAPQQQQQPQQVVIMPSSPVVTHRWDDQPNNRTTAQAQPTNSRSGSYAIRPGDTLSEIAEAHGLGLSTLFAANPGIDPLRLRVGQNVTIPSANFRPSTTTPRNYQVQPGDTLSEIAERHGIRLSTLMSLNPGIRPERLRVGKTLNLTGAISQPSPQTPAQLSSNHQPQQPATSKPTQASPRVQPAHNPAPLPDSPARKLLVRIPRQKSLGEIADDFRTDVDTLNRLNNVALSATHPMPANSTLYVPTK